MELIPEWHGRRLLAPMRTALLVLAGPSRARAQCQGTVSCVDVAADCTARNNGPALKTDIDPKKPYSFEELIDIAACAAHGPKHRSVPTSVLAALTNYDWQGNIRELRNLLERAVILTNGSVLQVAMPELIGKPAPLHRGACRRLNRKTPNGRGSFGR